MDDLTNPDKLKKKKMRKKKEKKRKENPDCLVKTNVTESNNFKQVTFSWKQTHF